MTTSWSMRLWASISTAVSTALEPANMYSVTSSRVARLRSARLLFAAARQPPAGTSRPGARGSSTDMNSSQPVNSRAGRAVRDRPADRIGAGLERDVEPQRPPLSQGVRRRYARPRIERLVRGAQHVGVERLEASHSPRSDASRSARARQREGRRAARGAAAGRSSTIGARSAKASSRAMLGAIWKSAAFSRGPSSTPSSIHASTRSSCVSSPATVLLAGLVGRAVGGAGQAGDERARQALRRPAQRAGMAVDASRTPPARAVPRTG